MLSPLRFIHHKTKAPASHCCEPWGVFCDDIHP
jgi:hypothetical protein